MVSDLYYSLKTTFLRDDLSHILDKLCSCVRHELNSVSARKQGGVESDIITEATELTIKAGATVFGSIWHGLGVCDCTHFSHSFYHFCA